MARSISLISVVCQPWSIACSVGGRRVPLFLSDYTTPTHRNAEFPYWVDPQL